MLPTTGETKRSDDLNPNYSMRTVDINALGRGIEVMANHSLDPTRNGMPLQAVISFSAFRVLPSRSAQLER